jgi:hypothetical protein
MFHPASQALAFTGVLIIPGEKGWFSFKMP